MTVIPVIYWEGHPATGATGSGALDVDFALRRRPASLETCGNVC